MCSRNNKSGGWHLVPIEWISQAFLHNQKSHFWIVLHFAPQLCEPWIQKSIQAFRSVTWQLPKLMEETAPQMPPTGGPKLFDNMDEPGIYHFLFSINWLVKITLHMCHILSLNLFIKTNLKISSYGIDSQNFRNLAVLPVFKKVWSLVYCASACLSMQSTMLLWQICPSVRPSYAGIVSKRMHNARHQTLAPSGSGITQVSGMTQVFEACHGYKITELPQQGH